MRFFLDEHLVFLLPSMRLILLINQVISGLFLKKYSLYSEVQRRLMAEWWGFGVIVGFSGSLEVFSLF